MKTTEVILTRSRGTRPRKPSRKSQFFFLNCVFLILRTSSILFRFTDLFIFSLCFKFWINFPFACHFRVPRRRFVNRKFFSFYIGIASLFMATSKISSRDRQQKLLRQLKKLRTVRWFLSTTLMWKVIEQQICWQCHSFLDKILPDESITRKVSIRNSFESNQKC